MASYVQIPPDSTGKKIRTDSRLEIQFDNQTGDINIGDIISGASSLATGTITGIVTQNFAANSGEIYLDAYSGTFENNENIEILSITVAVANIPNGQEETETQHVIVSDPDNPHFKQRIDEFGATVNTFTDGSPTFAPFGAMIVAGSTTIRDYKHAYNALPECFYNEFGGTASCTFLPNESSILLDTGSPGTSASDYVKRTSHYYHPYYPGIGNQVEQTIVLGDSGKANNVRRWGLFDDNDGVFWELDGSSLYVVVRSSTSGSPIDTRTAQVDFSDNDLLGSDARSFNLDVTKTNIYWIDFQWLGVGRVKFGVFNGIEKKTAHVSQHANIESSAYMRTGTLPLRYENVNTGITSGNSQLKNICASVKALGTPMPQHQHYADTHTHRIPISYDAGETIIGAVRARTTFGGVRNSVTSRLDHLHFHNAGDAQGIIRVYKNAVILGGDWEDIETDISSTQRNITATAFSGGRLVWSSLIDANSILGASLAPETGGNNIDETLQYLLEADNTTQQTMTITITPIDSGTSLSIFGNIEWIEFPI